MPAHARKRIVDETAVGIYHCVNRCVRRALLCGQDSASQQNFEHRKRWIRQRLEHLAGLFAIDILGFAVMSNHLHLLVRNRPDVAAGWSGEEVARRWCRLFARSRPVGQPDAVASAALNELRERMLLADADRLAECRRRLSSISWLMRTLCQPIARAANHEDGVTGRFWEGRFGCQALLDETAVLACSLYVDLNPIRAGVAETPETSLFTSACQRIADRQAGTTDRPEAQSGWLAPLPDADVNRPGVPLAGASCPTPSWPAAAWPAPSCPTASAGSLARRASSRGFLPMSLDDYLRLLDWTGRCLREGCAAIPPALAPIFERLRLKADRWLDCIAEFGRQFHRAAGRAVSLERFARQVGQRWLHGLAWSRQAFD